MKPKKRNVVTWQTTQGATVDVCRICERRLRKARQWVWDGSGRNQGEYCQVAHGEHRGICAVCDPGDCSPTVEIR